MDIYFDTCALNRLTDDPSQARVRAEIEAMVQLLDRVAEGKCRWIASTVLQFEIEQNPDSLRRIRALSLLPPRSTLITPTAAAIARALSLARKGFSWLDALHLAVAEQEVVDWLISTDDRFVRRASYLPGQRTAVINPVDLVQRRFPWLLPNP